MFAARFHDDNLSTFSRQEALEKLPASNPFLKGLFDYIAGPALPRRLEYIVDDLVQVMRASDPHSLFRDFGKFTARNDPFVHFYETFLAAYNPKKRKSRGVWYPLSPEVFRHVSEKGETLRRLHLMEPGAIGDTPFSYLGDGDDVVAAGYPKFEGGKVHVNKDQFFEDVPEIAWTFRIGGYQPAQKWLKDRRGRTLSFEDITHYQKVVKILAETDRIMKEIELPLD